MPPVLIENASHTIEVNAIARTQGKEYCRARLARLYAVSDRQAKEINSTEKHILNPHAVQPQEGKASCVVYIVFPIFLLALTLFETI